MLHLGITVGGGYLPPGPLSCPACGGARSGTGGRSDSRTYPGNPPQGMPLLSMPKGIRSGMYMAPPGGGGPSQFPLSHSVLYLAVPILFFHLNPIMMMEML